MGVGLRDAAQMCFAEDDEMVHALAPDRSDRRSAKPSCQGELPSAPAERSNSMENLGVDYINRIPLVVGKNLLEDLPELESCTHPC